MSITSPADAAIATQWLRKASGSACRVFDYLRSAQIIAGKHRRLWVTPRLKTIAADLGISVRTARRAVQWLAARGLIVVQHRFKRLRSGVVWQVASRIRVMLSTAAALTFRTALEARKAAVAARQAGLAKHRASYSTDRSGHAGTKETSSRPYKTSETYRQLMIKGIGHRR